MGYNIREFKLFICYKEDNGSLYAELTKLLLSKGGVKSFVAHIERNKHAEDFDKMRQELLQVVDFFLFINTEGALSRSEIINEFKMAFPNGKPDGKRLIIIHHGKKSRPMNEEFKRQTGLVIPKNTNIPSFQDEDELVDLIINLSKTYKIASVGIPRSSVKKELKLVKYLKYCYNLKETRNKLDNTILADMYIHNSCIESAKKTWNLDEEKVSDYPHKPWTMEDFLKNNDRYVLVGASYGIGKTYFSYKIASDLAAKALKNLSTASIPIHIPLRFQLNKVDNKGNNLDSIMSLIPRQRKVLFIYDGLDEFGEAYKTNIFYNCMQNRLKKYPNSKAVVTTRLNSNLPDLFNIDTYVRMMPFDNSQIDLFFQKYRISLRSDKISKLGLGLNEIGKPLFCNMISVLYKQNKRLFVSKKLSLNRTLLFFEVIHSVVLGKHEMDADNYSYTKHQLNEKRLLRKIAEMKFIYGDSLARTSIYSSLKMTHPQIKKQFIEGFDKLISSYFYIQDNNKNEQRIDFIHKSFVEYLLAEYCLECCFRNQLNRINMSILTLETISFLEGLLHLIKSEKDVKNLYFERMIETFGLDKRKKEEVRSLLINIAESNFESNQVLMPEDNGEYPQMVKIVKHLNLQNYRWIAVLLLNNLADDYKIDNKAFFDFVRSTNNSILGNIITIENLNLSGSDLTKGLGNYNLSGAKISHSTFHGDYYGTKFIGADLSFSNFEHGTKFIGVDFSGANLSKSHVVLKGEHSPFVLHFINCDFNKCKLINSDLRETSFTLSKFYGTDISGANLNYADISLTDIFDIILDNKTNTKNINLLSKGFEYEWENIRKNKELIRTVLDSFDPVNFDIKMKEKILADNPDYA